MLDLVVAMTGDSVKVAGNGVNPDSGDNSLVYYPDDATFRSRIDFFLRECRRRGLLVYWNMNSEPVRFVGTDASDTFRDTVAIPAIKKVAGWLEVLGPDIIVTMDVVNEWGIAHGARGWPANDVVNNQKITDTRIVMNAVRSSCSFPVTLSVLVGNHAGMGDGNVYGQSLDAAQDYDIEYQGVHPYMTYGGSTDNINNPPSDTDFTVTYAGRFSQCPKVAMDENGVDSNQNNATINSAWLVGLGKMGGVPNSFCTTLFCLSDYSATGNFFGAYDYQLNNPRQNVIDAFKGWVSAKVSA